MNPLLTVKAKEQTKEILRRNLDEIQSRIDAACAHSGRSPESIKLVLSTKYVDAGVIRLLYQLGISDVGENRVQDTQQKQELLSDLPIRWHMFGHLQRNKIKKALRLFELTHSVDSVALAEEISETSMGVGKRMKVLVEVNVSGEPQKYGLKPEETIPFLEKISPMQGLQVLGLMAMTPLMDIDNVDTKLCRGIFRGLKQLSEDVEKSRIENIKMDYLSMGMTQDFEIAVEEGSNLVRIGSAVFRGI
ncbi:MAG TPA: YggS family pyridoxal phosphate-dependent enzyme [Candidatus Avalokitesvara rifleensis]|uniref:YggS family pyridoxal phosphate-dependent enzyme n=1 Tax=Candidatus Avalokitesvara rifleensis TaxID=3367620 RepID=UPI004024D023